MEQAEKLAALLQKLQINKEKVPFEVLKTKYKVAYESLCEEIKQEAEKHLKTTAAALPEWLSERKAKKQYMQDIAEIFNSIYVEGNYAKKIGQALFDNYSIAEAEALAKEINEKLQEGITKYLHTKTCLYATAECFDEKNPKTPKIYNDLLGMFWEETDGGGSWREPKPGEIENAILIFIGDSQEEKKHG